MPTWLKYLLLQIPGWAIAGVVLVALWHWQILTSTLALIGFTALLLKDLILYPFLRHAYENNAKTGSEALIGVRGVAQSDLDPHGFVRVRGELWRAIAVPAHQTVSSGAKVEIISAEGMKLFVRALPEE